MTANAPIFTKLTTPRWIYVKDSRNERHEYPTNGLVVDTMSKTEKDRRTDGSVFQIRRF
jgi:hypothetical protein